MVEKDFGKHVRELRLAKGWTKEEFCGDEKGLCVRQLTRIETGKSKPGLDKLMILAERFGITVSELIGEAGKAVELPAEYLKLKYQLIHTPSYDNVEILTELDKKLDIIFNEYYDELPEEEQMIVDIMQSKIYSYSSDTHQKYGMSILQKYRKYLSEDRIYTVNDLLLIQLYQIALGDSEEIRSASFNRDEFNRIAENLLKCKPNIEFDYLFLLRDALFTIPAVEHERREFQYTACALQQLNEMMEESQDYQKKPILRMMEGQYFFFVEQDIEKANIAYQEASTVARLLGNAYLAEKILEEQRKDYQL